jgi:hypothetical protein
MSAYHFHFSICNSNEGGFQIFRARDLPRGNRDFVRVIARIRRGKIEQAEGGPSGLG